MECRCEVNPKLRVDSDDWTKCQGCGELMAAASKKRVIKNRNDPKFWGLNVKEKVSCGNCLEIQKEKMPSLRKVEFNRYRKVGRL